MRDTIILNVEDIVTKINSILKDTSIPSSIKMEKITHLSFMQIGLRDNVIRRLEEEIKILNRNINKGL